jgi:hypothetical protein
MRHSFSVLLTHAVFRDDVILSVRPPTWGITLHTPPAHARGFGVRVPVGVRFVSSPRRPEQFWGPLTVLSPGVKWPGREADHLPPSSGEVRDTWIYTYTPPYAFVA